MISGLFAIHLFASPVSAASLQLANDPSTGGTGKFSEAEIRREAAAKPTEAQITLTFEKYTKASPQSYRIERNGDQIRVFGSDAVGAMYGGLDIAEAIRTGAVDSLKDSDHKPHIEKRGIKFNIPLDLRTPSYSDNSTSAQANIPAMWSLGFWHEFLDRMARDRFNVLTLWSMHPFPFIVKVPEYPKIALDDVWRTTADLVEPFESFSLRGIGMVKPWMLEKKGGREAHHHRREDRVLARGDGPRTWLTVRVPSSRTYPGRTSSRVFTWGRTATTGVAIS